MDNTTTISEFLRLPAESMPAAQWLDDDDSGAWSALRDMLRPSAQQRINHVGDRVRLSADRDGWRDGVVVEC